VIGGSREAEERGVVAGSIEAVGKPPERLEVGPIREPIGQEEDLATDFGHFPPILDAERRSEPAASVSS